MFLKIFNSVFLTIFLLSFLSMMLSDNPIILGITLIFQSMTMALNLSKTFLISWFSFFIFIIYLGGILMILSYVISIMKMKFLTNNVKKILWIFFLNFFFIEYKWNLDYSHLKLNLEQTTFTLLSSTKSATIFFTTFLLMIMVMSVFLTESEKGNMRTN